MMLAAQSERIGECSVLQFTLGELEHICLQTGSGCEAIITVCERRHAGSTKLAMGQRVAVEYRVARR